MQNYVLEINKKVFNAFFKEKYKKAKKQFNYTKEEFLTSLGDKYVELSYGRTKEIYVDVFQYIAEDGYPDDTLEDGKFYMVIDEDYLFERISTDLSKDLLRDKMEPTLENYMQI